MPLEQGDLKTMRRSRPILLVVTVLFAAISVIAQEPAKVDLPLEIDARIRIEDLLLNPSTLEATAMLANDGPSRPLGKLVPIGTVLVKTGQQTVMVLAARGGSSASASMDVRQSERFSAASLGSMGGWHGGAVLWTGFVAAAAEPNPAAATRIPVELDLLCVEADKSDPADARGWTLLRQPNESLAEKQGYLRRLAQGVARTDEKIALLAKHVQLKRVADQVTLEYDGETLNEANANFLRVADWSTSPDGRTCGRLNRSAVVQFSLWCLTDNYTEDDLERRINEPRFKTIQARVGPVRWAVRCLLSESGFKEALFDPFSAEVSYNRGVDLLRSGDARQAEQHFRQAISRRADYGLAIFNLGLALARQEKWNEARSAFQDARRLLPGDADVSYNLGVIAWHESKWDEAASSFTAALSVKPDHRQAQRWLAASKQKMSQG